MRIIIVGAGVMGLNAAVAALKKGWEVVVLERREKLFSPGIGSHGHTRSFRHDYLDEQFIEMAAEARSGWLELEKQMGVRGFIPCPCVNLISREFTPSLEDSYGMKAGLALQKAGRSVDILDAADLKKRYPVFQADGAVSDPNAGLLLPSVLLPRVIQWLQENGADLRVGVKIRSVREGSNGAEVETEDEILRADAVLMSAGIWTNEVLALVEGSVVEGLPITPDRPLSCRYMEPFQGQIQKFTAPQFPIFACLDIGLYGHAMVPGVTRAPKVGVYRPAATSSSMAVTLEDAVQRFLPGLNVSCSEQVTDVDGGFYEMVADDDFIIGSLTRNQGVWMVGGFCGTGFKFAPCIGASIVNAIADGGVQSGFERFSPSRFRKNNVQLIGNGE